jgi:hypothetical protein
MKHKHAELIKAWADGAEIECKADSSNLNDWIPCLHPFWDDDSVEFRIKPEEPKMRDMYIYKCGSMARIWIDEKPPEEAEMGTAWEYIGRIGVFK